MVAQVNDGADHSSGLNIPKRLGSRGQVMRKFQLIVQYALETMWSSNRNH
jgi:hypothetical protein